MQRAQLTSPIGCIQVLQSEKMSFYIVMRFVPIILLFFPSKTIVQLTDAFFDSLPCYWLLLYLYSCTMASTI
jgi:hypothetical protein